MTDLPANYEPEFESLKNLMIEIAQERSLDALLAMIVQRFAERPHLALARIWLVKPSDSCVSCASVDACHRRDACLHLVASAGRSVVDPAADWSRIDDTNKRLPLGWKTIGRIAASGESVQVRDVKPGTFGLDDLDWAERERIRGFAAEPLVYRGEVLGVIAIFVRIQIPGTVEGRGWLRLVADQAAAAIANARAFGEIERLRHQLELENAYLRREVLEAKSFDQIIGQSEVVRRLGEQIDSVAQTDASVLILGETGTGKELVAREIHRRSRRQESPLIKVNCAAIPRELWESEFFGHVRGAFTGAVRERAGRFELAHRGTLFLDEVGEIPLALQSRLLRVLQEGQFERVGDEVTRKVDVRVISASNRNLAEALPGGAFRRDLYYRLNVFPIEVPPLRQRREDIPLLVNHFLKLARNKRPGKRFKLTAENIDGLIAYDWPGNVRELQNVVERATITARDETPDFARWVGNREAGTTQAADLLDSSPPLRRGIISAQELKRLEAENVKRALEQTGGKIYGAGGAAALLGMKPTTLASRVKKLKGQ